MNYFRRLNPRVKFGAPNNRDMIINIICGVLIVILIIVIVCCLCCNKNEDKFGNEEVIYMVHRGGCPYSEKALKAVKENGNRIGSRKVEVIAMDDEKVKKLGKIDGTPGFFLESTGAVVMGAQPLEAIEKGLMGKESFGNNQELVLISANGCGFAKKAEQMLDENQWKINGIQVKKVDINSAEGQKYGAQGTPTYFLNGKKSVGAKPLQVVAEELGLTGKESFGNVGNSLSVIGSMRCPFCIKQYSVLDESGIKYNKIDSNSLEGKEHMGAAKANGVPLLKFGDKYIVGFNDKDSLDKLGIK